MPFCYSTCCIVNTKQLRYFTAVATEGTFTRASAKLRVAQPALSRQIALLESELGTALLIRHRRGVGLTDAGAALLDRARPVLLSLDRIQSEIMDYSAAPAGPLRIGCTPTLTSRLVVKPVLRIRERLPNVAVQIQEGVSHQLCRAVLSDELDAAIVSENLAESFLAAEALFEEQVWLFGPLDKKTYRRKATLQQICKVPMILARSPQTTRRIVDHALAAAKLKLNVVAESDSIQATREFIVSGIGHTIAPYSALIGDVQRGLMFGCPIEPYSIRRSLVRRNDRPISRALQDFRTFLVEAVTDFGRDLAGVTVLRN
jgi:LysR family nitrogen assimilation transcriptional regulator